MIDDGIPMTTMAGMEGLSDIVLDFDHGYELARRAHLNDSGMEFHLSGLGNHEVGWFVSDFFVAAGWIIIPPADALRVGDMAVAWYTGVSNYIIVNSHVYTVTPMHRSTNYNDIWFRRAGSDG